MIGLTTVLSSVTLYSTAKENGYTRFYIKKCS